MTAFQFLANYAENLSMEAWTNTSHGNIYLVQSGSRVGLLISGGRTFLISTDDRILNESLAYSPAQDLFADGTLIPANSDDIIVAGISSVETLLGVMTTDDHEALDHTNQLGVFVHSSFIVVWNDAPITVGNEWTQITGLVLGSQDYDTEVGPDLVLADGMDSINVFYQGRYRLDIKCQLENPTDDGWFEAALEPNGLSLLIWPSDITNGHNGTWVPATAASLPNVNLGFEFSMNAQLGPGSQISGWIRYLTEHGSDATPSGTIDVSTILSVMRLTL